MNTLKLAILVAAVTAASVTGASADPHPMLHRVKHSVTSTTHKVGHAMSSTTHKVAHSVSRTTHKASRGIRHTANRLRHRHHKMVSRRVRRQTQEKSGY